METLTSEALVRDSQYQICSPNPVVYRANDIRGVVGQDLSEDVYFTLGLSFGSMALAKQLNRVVVGRDGRLTGLAYKQALIAGLKQTGMEVIDIDLVPSPMLYYATYALKTGTGMMITGSHNPPQYNGLKMMMGGKTLNQEGILALKERIDSRQFRAGEGFCVSQDLLDAYIDDICSKIKIARPLKVVIDCGHGAGAVVAKKLYAKLGLDATILYGTVDGQFPAHHPDPSVVSNLKDLIDEVKAQGADLGLAFDGDADRLGCVTKEGEVIWPDRQLMLYAQQTLRDNPGAPIIFDVKCSSHLSKWIEQHGGKPCMDKTGHAFIKAKMVAVDSPLAGEMSGHFFFGKPWYGFDDGLYAGAKLCEIISQSSLSANEVFQTLPNSINTPEIQIKCADDQKFAFVESLKATQAFGDAQIITIDGLRVEYEDGWGLVRASNTSPCLVLRFEADSSQRLAQIQTEFKQALLAVDHNLEIPF